ncbi:acetate kinase [Microaerobacter geothermalis]|uniref:acetate/propionate family kinase n=1 Tax=Microaerobacter geothermalis TaxID=674972 RepID=UPI001F1B20B3|nr:acetate kinase [Microaerobacter geothermalis]MCF6093334.1 acetate kinase [Microaerobacter geothermalis]
MKVLVINCGSSSLKYQLFEMKNETVLAKGGVERIGMETAILTHRPHGKEEVKKVAEILEHTEAIRQVLQILVDPKYGVLQSIKELNAIGHRVVHGGETFSDSVLITDDVKQAIRGCFELAPLHNPPNLKGILAAEDILPNVPQVAVFDTAFHQTMPKTSYLYALPKALYRRHKVRRYGFHGTSHKYVSERLQELMGVPLEELKVISCHIGNGASITAIKNGKSMDTSMGMTPLEGLIMGTRSGDIDPAIVPFTMAKEDLTIGEVSSMLNKHSGLYGISGISSDMREIEQAMFDGNERAKLAFDMYIYRIVKYVGAYTAAMNGLDALIFTAGVGENSVLVRKKVCESLNYLGVELDDEKNGAHDKKERMISGDNSKVKVFVIPTNEELMIARDTVRIAKLKK